MKKAVHFSFEGNQLDKVELPKQIFDSEINAQLLGQAVRVYQSDQRTARAKAKTRGEVTGSGRKIWRQKGTGRARHGDQYAPIFVGGGVAHGPRGNQNYKLTMGDKMKKQALYGALTTKLNEEKLFVVSGLEKIEAKTKTMAKLLQKINGGKVLAPHTLIVLPKPWENVHRAARNIAGVMVTTADSLNTYQILKSNLLLFADSAIDKLSPNQDTPRSEKQKVTIKPPKVTKTKPTTKPKTVLSKPNRSKLKILKPVKKTTN